MKDLFKEKTKPYIPFTFYHIKGQKNIKYNEERRNKYVKCKLLNTNKYVSSEFYKLIFKPF